MMNDIINGHSTYIMHYVYSEHFSVRTEKRKHADGQELSSSHTTVLNDESLGKESENIKEKSLRKKFRKVSEK